MPELCGNLKRRSMVLSLLGELPVVPTAENEEVLALLDREKLYGRGLGWIDAHLLASAMLADCPIRTLDVSLRRAAAHYERHDKQAPRHFGDSLCRRRTSAGSVPQGEVAAARCYPVSLGHTCSLVPDLLAAP